MRSVVAKGVLVYLLSLLLTYGLASATDINISVLSVSPKSQVIGYKGGTLQFGIFNSGSTTPLEWTVSLPEGDNTDWITIEQPSGKGDGLFYVTVSEYTGDTPRSCVLTVSAKGAFGSPKSITITQYPTTDVVLTSSVGHLSIPANGHDYVVRLYNTGYQDVAFDSVSAKVSSDTDWLSVVRLDDPDKMDQYACSDDAPCYIVTAKATNVATMRMGQIEFQASFNSAFDGTPYTNVQGVPLVVSVMQYGSDHTLVVDPLTLDLDNKAQTAELKLSFDSALGIPLYPWQVSVTSGNDWLKLTSASTGIGNTTVKLSIAANIGSASRVGAVVISCDGAANSPITVTVTQAGTANNTMIGAKPGFISVEVKADEAVDLAINSTNAHGDKPKYEWFLAQMITGNVISPIYLITPIGLFDATSVLAKLPDYVYPFDPSGITVLGSWKMADLGFKAGDTFIYAYAYQKENGDIVVDNIVTICIID